MALKPRRPVAMSLIATLLCAGGMAVASQPPLTANAGPDRRVGPGRVVLDGRASRHPAAAPLSYQWSFTGGPAAVRLSDDTTATPSVELTTPGTYTFGLRVYDAFRTSQMTEVAISVDDLPPSVGAGNDRLVPTGRVDLKGFASDPNGQPLGVAWVQVKGPRPVTLADPRALATSFTAPVDATGVYVFMLKVTDGVHTTGSAPVTIEVDDPPTAHAYANPTGLEPGERTELNGSASADRNPEDNPLAYAWSVVSGPEKGAVAQADQPYARFSAKRSGEYQLRLEVRSRANKRSARADLTVRVKNAAPVAQAPASVEARREDVELAGSATDGNEDPLTYQWTQLEGPEPLAFSDATAARTTVRIGKPGTYRVQLVAKDAELESEPAVTTIVSKNTAPVPRPFAPPVAPPGPVVLDGTGSVDADGDPVLYVWTQVAGPPVPIAERASPRPVVVLAVPAVYVFELRVNDGVAFSFPARVTITVR